MQKIIAGEQASVLMTSHIQDEISRKTDENILGFYKLLFRWKPERQAMWWAAALAEFFFVIALVFQLITSLGEYHEIIWQNICYMAVLGLLWPVLSTVLFINFAKG